MRVYTYSREQCGWPSGLAGFRLAGADPCRDPSDADVLVCPVEIHEWQRTGRKPRMELPSIDSLRRLLVSNVGECEEVASPPGCIALRCDAVQSVMDRDPWTIPWPWPVEDRKDCMAYPDGEPRFDVSFVGMVWPNGLNRRAIDVIRRSSLRADIVERERFFGYVDADTQRAWTSRFLVSTAQSRFMLAPCSRLSGVLRYRVFEALSAGRVPVIIGDGVVLPFADQIPWDCLAVRVASRDVVQLPDIIQNWLGGDVDGQVARRVYEQWLCRDRWPEIAAWCVRRRLGMPVGPVP
jgi:hypothetical protein